LIIGTDFFSKTGVIFSAADSCFYFGFAPGTKVPLLSVLCSDFPLLAFVQEDQAEFTGYNFLVSRVISEGE
jgi:hypothetical protein